MKKDSRLAKALDILGYHQATQLHHQSNLLNAIALFAGVQGDVELEQDCEREVAKIREANARAYVPGMDEATAYQSDAELRMMDRAR